MSDQLIAAAQRILDGCVASGHTASGREYGRACWAHREAAMWALGHMGTTRGQRAWMRRMIDGGQVLPDPSSMDASELAEYVRVLQEAS